MMLAFCMRELHFSSMASITVRDIPEATRSELAARAARSGRSLQEYLRGEMIELARRPDVHALLASARDRKARTGSKLNSRQILVHRDRDRK